jgi:hypothetical protein
LGAAAGAAGAAGAGAGAGFPAVTVPVLVIILVSSPGWPVNVGLSDKFGGLPPSALLLCFTQIYFSGEAGLVSLMMPILPRIIIFFRHHLPILGIFIFPPAFAETQTTRLFV